MESIRKDIESGQFKNVYLLSGGEVYLRSQYKRSLVKALVPDGDTMNFTVYEGKDTDVNDLISQAETLPFFAERRVILAEDTGFFKNKCEALADYLEHLPDYLVLIFSESEIDKRSRTFKAVQKYGHAASFETQSEDILIRWVYQKITKAGKKITRADLLHFLDLTGTDMTNISSELDKLLSYTLDKNVVTGQDIDAICTQQITGQIFDMLRAVTEHRQREALDLYYDLLALKEPPMRILYLLTRQFNQLLQAGALAKEGLPNREIASLLGIPSFAVGRTLALARKYEPSQLTQIVRECVQAETEVKTGLLDEKLSVEMLIVKYSK